MQILSSLELFAGAGGLATGIGEHGIHHHAFIEWNKDACATLQSNYDSDLILNNDVRKYRLFTIWFCGSCFWWPSMSTIFFGW